MNYDERSINKKNIDELGRNEINLEDIYDFDGCR